MFPYRDDNPTVLPPVATVAIIIANVLAWVLIQGLGSEPALTRADCILGGTPTWYTPVTSMFLHGGWLHLIGNMWFLWVFGNNIEDSMGYLRYILFYLICGLGAAAAQMVVNPASTIPMVGASGAISGIMGAYIVLYPRVRVHMLVFLGFFITTIAVPAWVMLGYWFLLQVLGGLPALAQESGGVAFWAHAGGFIAGMVLIWLFRNRTLVARRTKLVSPYGWG
jgi:membrane associated rhomboid family serine protease